MSADPEPQMNRDATIEGGHSDGFIELSRQVLASGEHAGTNALELVTGYREGLVEVGVKGAVVTRRDSDIEELSGQRRFESPR